MIRKAFAMQLKPGCEAEYENRHNPIWPELHRALEDHGASNYSIFLHPDSLQLFGYVELESEERWNALANTSACREWWAFMADLMETEADKRPVSTPLCPVFHID